MAKTGNPFLDHDLAAFFDPKRFADFFDYTKFAEQMRMPKFDAEKVLESQRRNIEALSEANRIALEGAQQLTKLQMDIFSEIMGEVKSAAEDLSKSKSPEEAVSKQSELMRHGFELALKEMRSLAELAATNNQRTADVFNTRIGEAIDEIRNAMEAKAGKAK